MSAKVNPSNGSTAENGSVRLHGMRSWRKVSWSNHFAWSYDPAKFGVRNILPGA